MAKVAPTPAMSIATVFQHRRLFNLFLGLSCLFGATPAIAQTANFGSLSLTPGFELDESSLNGYTGGSYSFSALTNRDQQGNSCLGYGDSQPDYIFTLEQDFTALQLVVDSGGADTTLVIQGPEGFWCGNDIDDFNPDANVLSEDLKAGTYSVWVGTMTPGDRQNYTLTISEEQSEVENE